MNELQPLIDLLSAKCGWVSALPVWIGGLMALSRLVLKPFNTKLQNAMTSALASAKSDPEDSQWWHDKILTRGWYRVGAFLSDLVLSVKLPTHADFHALTNTPKP